MFAPGAALPADTVQGGWKGVLFANLALIDPVASWNFFAQQNFDLGWVDGGASRTWYLALAAGECTAVFLETISRLFLAFAVDVADYFQVSGEVPSRPSHLDSRSENLTSGAICALAQFMYYRLI